MSASLQTNKERKRDSTQNIRITEEGSKCAEEKYVPESLFGQCISVKLHAVKTKKTPKDIM